MYDFFSMYKRILPSGMYLKNKQNKTNKKKSQKLVILYFTILSLSFK